MSKSLTIRKGDKVRVIAGKDKDKEGKVLFAYPEKERVVVEGVAFVKRHTRASQQRPAGGIVEREGAIHVSNVMLVCPICSEATRVSRRREDGVRIRTCKKCGKGVG